MQIPDTERVIYKYNPLVEVVSQLQFPPILRITSQDPVDFQDAIRADYPVLKIPSRVLVVDTLGERPPDAQRLDTVYHFKSEDLQWEASLSNQFVALMTKKYTRYEEFKQRFEKVVKAFEEIYKPSFYSRVGLRYQDLIIRSTLGLKEERWSDLIPNHIAPELHCPEIADDVVASTKTLVIKMTTGQVALRHGLVEARDTEQSLLEPAYLLDADCFCQERMWDREPCLGTP